MKKYINPLLSIIYWLTVATIPFLIWFGKTEYEYFMECYLDKNCNMLDGLPVVYWEIVLIYVIVLLWPICIWKIINTFKNIMFKLKNET